MAIEKKYEDEKAKLRDEVKLEMKITRLFLVDVYCVC